jgi:transcriptional regulator with GAF, ATPase, and Fis domain
MATQTSWACEAFAVNPTGSFEIEDAASADSNELCGNGLPRIVGNSAALRRVLGLVRVVAPTGATALINGETGTGKELIAKAIHNQSSRRDAPFVKINCAAIPADLLESELFGHEKGAFTGAVAQTMGRFQLAHKGTLFLDEIGDLPLQLQPKLLRVLQEQEFERLGSGRSIKVDVRVVTATNQELLKMVQDRQFRADLYYRLNVFPILLPPLRERREDITLLVSHFVEIFSRRMDKRITYIPKETLDAFTSYCWPGNVRELQNLIERAVIRSDNGVLSNPFSTSDTNLVETKPDNRNFVTLPSAQEGTFRDCQRAVILRALDVSGWIIGGPRGAAARLGLKRTTLISKMKKLRISRPVRENQADRLLEEKRDQEMTATNS